MDFLKAIVILIAIPIVAGVLTEGEENFEKRVAVFAVLALAGCSFLAFYSEIFTTWRGYLANVVGWLCWWAKMIVDPYDDYRTRRYGATSRDPVGIMTLILMTAFCGFMLELFFPPK